MDNQYHLDKLKIRKSFDRAADTYDASAMLQQEVAKRLVERLDYIRQQPNTVLDLGCGTGNIASSMIARYPKANILALDLSYNMLKKTKKQGGWFSKKPLCICADAENLPLKKDSVDLLISSLMLQWSNDIHATFRGFRRVISPNGLLMFTTFGPDTLKEIRASWAMVDNKPHTSQFTDMHDIGDALLAAGFSNPVMDMDMMTVTYESVRELMRDIKNIGASNATEGRSKGLMGKQRLADFEAAYEDFRDNKGLYPTTWEVIYGHAWVPEGMQMDDFKKVIPIQSVN